MNSLLDDVNALLKLNQGNKIRLEHIKKTLESKKVLYISDSKYLRELTREFLENFEGKRLTKFNSYDYPEYANRLDTPEQPESKLDQSSKVESTRNLFCGNCGNSIKDENFCPKCGHSLQLKKSDDIDETKNKELKIDEKKDTPRKEITNNNKSSKKIIIGLGVLIAVIVVGAVAMNGDVINNINGDMKTSEKQVVTNPIPSSANTNSKCGTGTIFDETINSCVLEGTQSTEKIIAETQSNTNSKCGTGTIFDSVTNTCVIP